MHPLRACALPVVAFSLTMACPRAVLADEPCDKSVAALKLGVAEVGLRNDACRFAGAFQLAPYNGARDFTGAGQFGFVNTVGSHPWVLPSLQPRSEGESLSSLVYRGGVQMGLVNAVGGDFAGGLQVGLVNITGGSFRGLAQVGLANAAGDGSAQALQLGVWVSASEMTGVQLGLLSFARSFQGVQLGVAANSVKLSMRGLQLGFVNEATTIHGGRGGPDWGGRKGHVEGVQLGVLWNDGDVVDGAQLGLVNASISGGVSGFQIGALDFATQLRGAQVGVLNVVASFEESRVEGVQLGLLFNGADIVNGAQLGPFNIAGTVRGLQIGVFNYAAHLRGVQIGAINIAQDGPIPFMPVLNAGWGA
jgi:hypothetical protein